MRPFVLLCSPLIEYNSPSLETHGGDLSPPSFNSLCLSVDEMMIRTRCRIYFPQYLPNKPTKFGIKVFVNAEVKTGYVLAFRVYTGKIYTGPENKGLFTI